MNYQHLLEAVRSDNTVALVWEPGLDEAQLDELEALLGHPLPGALRDFWRVMRPKEDMFGKHYGSWWALWALPIGMGSVPYGILGQAKLGEFWHDAWGKYPAGRAEAEAVVERVSAGRPPLIWLGERYYLPVLPDGQGGVVYDPPVLELDGYFHRFSVAYASLGVMYAIFWLSDPEAFLRGEGIDLCADAEVAQMPFWSEILSRPEGILRHEPYRQGVWYKTDDFRSMGYMGWSLMHLHDAALMDTEHRRGLRVHCIPQEQDRSYRYDWGEETLTLRLYASGLMEPAIIELRFRELVELPTLKRDDRHLVPEVFDTDVRVVTLPERGDYVCFSIDPTEGEDEVHGVRVPHTAEGLRVMAKHMEWRAITPELYYADVRLYEADAAGTERTAENSIAERWLAAFGAASNGTKTMKNGLIAGNILWDALAESPTLLIGDEARAAFDALEYERALVFRGGECVGEVPGGDVEAVDIREIGESGKLCAAVLESVDDVYVVAPDYAWCYVHTHEATALFVRRAL